MVRMASDGSCKLARAYSTRTSSTTHTIEAVVPASDAAPATKLMLTCERFSSACRGVDLLTLPLPGEFGEQLHKAPVDWDWDHAATMGPQDLDRLLTHYYKTLSMTRSPLVDQRVFAATCVGEPYLPPTSRRDECDDVAYDSEQESGSQSDEESVDDDIDALSCEDGEEEYDSDNEFVREDPDTGFEQVS